MAILAEIKDPRVMGVTVTRVEVTPDLRSAKVHVSIMGDDTKQKLCLHGLRSSAGFLQSKIAAEIDTRYTPRLEFVIDEGVKKSIELAAILKRVLPKDDAKAPHENDSSHEPTDGLDEQDENESVVHPSAPDEAS